MTAEQVWLRSEIMGTQVITRDSGRRLGVVGELLVDIDRREVVALGLRDNLLTRFLPGVPRYMFLSSIRQVGDVILVDNDDVIEDNFDAIGLSNLINCEVITEAGEPLGRVRGFKFDIATGKLESLVIASLGLAFVPESVLSTFELGVQEIVSGGPDRVIVFEGAEDRMVQLTAGLLEKLGLGGWDDDEYDRYSLPITPVENQLGAGEPLPPQRDYSQQPFRARREDRRQEELVEPLRQSRPAARRLYMDEEEAAPAQRRWEDEPAPRPRSQQPSRDRYIDEDEGYDDLPAPRVQRRADSARPAPTRASNPQPLPQDDDPFGDAWAEPDNSPELQLPQHQRQPEYEEG
ncbi:PRC-barrel domain-containing protein [Synechococcus elongatus]|uniref:PRC-barrel domain-containing protein n=1 Tax=Synechococcus elongatus PCC 11801 TaxID=2219813 RepID=A0AAN1QN58_SYNEL|nr:PRC-barrel domain-containing protein [Synechococcus elongatus]AZB72352.1 photosystem reaction center subunit H [Synechococcus elongatus PCC 11801]